jgi:LytS/YehU family sensor histidine kinase
MGRLEKSMDYVFARQRWAVHVLFWVLVLALYVVFFGRKNSNYLQTLFFVGLLMPVTIGTTYFLNYFLVPRFLLKERYAFFLLYFVYTLIGSIFLEMTVAMMTFLIMAEINIRNMSPASIDIFFLFTSLLMVVFLGVAVKLLLHWRQTKEDYQKLMRDKVEAELKFLKAQINPHFLFNTLNNLYYLATEKSERAPQAILQLSEMLDYAMHTGKNEMVPIEAELKQVENYIGLELLRYEDRVQVHTEVTGNLKDSKIGPMILITLIENAFKHGVMKVAGKSWIKLTVDSNTERTSISIRNSWKNGVSGNGIGLHNLRGQLDLLYDKNYELLIGVDNPGEFSVNLSINK